MDKLLASSADPKKVSATIQGALIAIVPILMAVFKLLDIPLSETGIYELITQISALSAIVVTLFGATRKVIILFKETFAGVFGKKTSKRK